jgi:hypothetical protein
MGPIGLTASHWLNENGVLTGIAASSTFANRNILPVYYRIVVSVGVPPSNFDDANDRLRIAGVAKEGAKARRCTEFVGPTVSL